MSAEWIDAAPQSGRGAEASDRGRRIMARTDASGTYRICGAPVNTALTLQAADDSTRSAVIPVRLADRRFTRVDMSMDRMPQRGTVLTGMVVDSLRQPISGADIALLDSVVVSEAATDPALSDFEDNRRIGLGHFFTRAEPAKVEQQKLADALWQAPGAGFIGGRFQAYIYSKRAPPAMCSTKARPDCFASHGYYVPNASEAAQGAQVACYPQIYLDGALMNTGNPTPPFDINSILPHQIEAIEWYSGPSQTPARYSGLGSRCGVLVIHTRRNP